MDANIEIMQRIAQMFRKSVLFVQGSYFFVERYDAPTQQSLFGVLRGTRCNTVVSMLTNTTEIADPVLMKRIEDVISSSPTVELTLGLYLCHESIVLAPPKLL